MLLYLADEFGRAREAGDAIIYPSLALFLVKIGRVIVEAQMLFTVSQPIVPPRNALLFLVGRTICENLQHLAQGNWENKALDQRVGLQLCNELGQAEVQLENGSGRSNTYAPWLLS